MFPKLQFQIHKPFQPRFLELLQPSQGACCGAGQRRDQVANDGDPGDVGIRNELGGEYPLRRPSARSVQVGLLCHDPKLKSSSVRIRSRLSFRFLRDLEMLAIDWKGCLAILQIRKNNGTLCVGICAADAASKTR